ncbi:MAG: hypothetical protein U1F68_13920 [Gammaproteobacteria bacterium]
MSVKTKSEILFESFCNSIEIQWRKIGESSKERPDYEINIADQIVFVEVKQFDPNTQEREANKRLQQGHIAVLGGQPGERIRSVIRKANSQLKELSKGKCCTLLIAYNNTPCSLHTDPYAVMTAMQGFDIQNALVHRNQWNPPSFGEIISGRIGRSMRPDCNTSTSAFATLHSDNAQRYLNVYHNRFAAKSLNPNFLRYPNIRHFQIPKYSLNSLANWEEV